jgi:hypothetical protein
MLKYESPIRPSPEEITSKTTSSFSGLFKDASKITGFLI